MKFVEPSHFNDPDAAARKLLEIANATEPAQGTAGSIRAGQQLPEPHRDTLDLVASALMSALALDQPAIEGLLAPDDSRAE
jgi:hypothetical protein